MSLVRAVRGSRDQRSRIPPVLVAVMPADSAADVVTLPDIDLGAVVALADQQIDARMCCLSLRCRASARRVRGVRRMCPVQLKTSAVSMPSGLPSMKNSSSRLLKNSLPLVS